MDQVVKDAPSLPFNVKCILKIQMYADLWTVANGLSKGKSLENRSRHMWMNLLE